MIIKNKWFLNYFKKNNVIATTIFPFIIFWRGYYSDVDLSHERIHIRQQMELLVIFFYLIYGLEYLIKGIKYKDFNIAYENISFEKEAYENESDLNYYKKRKLLSFIKYF